MIPVEIYSDSKLGYDMELEIAHVIHVLFTEFQTRTMARIVTMNMSTNASFAAQI